MSLPILITIGPVSTSLQSMTSEKSVTFDESSLKPPSGYKNGSAQVKAADSRYNVRYVCQCMNIRSRYK